MENKQTVFADGGDTYRITEQYLKEKRDRYFEEISNIFDERKDIMKLSNKEIYILSDGLLALINNASKAITLTNNEHAQCAISGDIHKYQRLNSKLMQAIKKQGGKADVEIFNHSSTETTKRYTDIDNT